MVTAFVSLPLLFLKKYDNKEKFINLQHIDAEVLFFKANSYLGTYKDIAIEIEYYTNFSPPDIAQDIQVLHQAFLI